MEKPEYHKGMIVRMELVDFMTYENVVIYAQPKFNFILGPNGTGKSTFLCAVIIGLGGKPSIIGRSTNVADYIKRGCKESKIEIELYNPDGVNYIITRIITSKSCSSWTLQGKSVDFKQISSVIEKLNIQINNLCMILPQDRVQDFAKMNKKQLLEHTQKLFGKGELEGLFDKLCKVRKDIKEQNDALKVKIQSYEKEKQVLERMEIDVKSYRERQETLKEIELMKKKEAWLAYEGKSSNLLQLHEDSKKLLAEYERAKELLKPHLCCIKDGQKKELELNNQIKAQRKAVAQIQQKMNDMKKQYLMIKNKVESIKDDFKEKIEAEKRKEVEVNSIKEQIQALLDSFPKQSEQMLISELKQIEKEMEVLLQQFSHIKSKENEVIKLSATVNQHLRSVQHKKREAESIQEKKFTIMQNYQDVNEAYKWITENRKLFTAPVYGPLFIELNVKKSENARYVETILPFRDLVAFACENPKDTSKLLSHLRDNRRLKINALTVPPGGPTLNEMFPPPYPIDSIQKYGFHSYLIDLIEGPDAILKYLCSKLAFHRIPVGTELVQEHANQVPNNIRLFFSETKVFNVNVSKYSGEKSLKVKDIFGSGFLEYSVNHELIRSLNQQMEVKVKELNDYQKQEADLVEHKKKIEIELNKARNNKKELSRKVEYMKASNVRLRMKREELARLDQTKFHLVAEEASLREKIKERIIEISEVNSVYLDILYEYHQAYSSESLLKLEVDAVAAKIKQSELQLKNEEANSLKLKEKVENIKSNIAKAKAEAKLFYNKAKELTDGLDPDNPRFVEKYQKLFSVLPKTLHELKDHLAETEAMFRCIQSSLSDKVIRDYDEKKFLLGQLGKDVEKNQTSVSVCQQQYLELKNKWMPEITNLITNINNKFSHSFSFLGCAGAVELDQGDNQEEIENYGISMKVKFRNESDMVTLNPFSHSGGEKALTIAIYLLSLQSIIKVPFRWVDEINQGMDEYNEVRVYYLMMCEVANDPMGQYFVITPKLVPGLKMSSETTVHVIYSGNFERKSESETDESNKKRKLDKSKKLKWSKRKYFEFLGFKNE